MGSVLVRGDYEDRHLAQHTDIKRNPLTPFPIPHSTFRIVHLNPLSQPSNPFLYFSTVLAGPVNLI